MSSLRYCKVLVFKDREEIIIRVKNRREEVVIVTWKSKAPII